MLRRKALSTPRALQAINREIQVPPFPSSGHRPSRALPPPPPSSFHSPIASTQSPPFPPTASHPQFLERLGSLRHRHLLHYYGKLSDDDHHDSNGHPGALILVLEYCPGRYRHAEGRVGGKQSSGRERRGGRVLGGLMLMAAGLGVPVSVSVVSLC